LTAYDLSAKRPLVAKRSYFPKETEKMEELS
jgi:hypothetical protein